jgi:hypothetical protein
MVPPIKPIHPNVFKEMESTKWLTYGGEVPALEKAKGFSYRTDNNKGVIILRASTCNGKREPGSDHRYWRFYKKRAKIPRNYHMEFKPFS